MTTSIRITLWVTWLAVVGCAWSVDWLGSGTAWAASGLSLMLFAWPSTHTRRSHTLDYVDVPARPR